jgi:hypothetical protein
MHLDVRRVAGDRELRRQGDRPFALFVAMLDDRHPHPLHVADGPLGKRRQVEGPALLLIRAAGRRHHQTSQELLLTRDARVERQALVIGVVAVHPRGGAAEISLLLGRRHRPRDRHERRYNHTLSTDPHQPPCLRP